ncbi:MAG TPA: DNA topoisomerase IB [Ohtaekwangia sp.]
MKTKAVEIDLSHQEFLTLNKDYEQAAAVVDLVYVKDDVAGITRKGSGKLFTYWHGNKRVTDSATLERIRKLAIPPAWTNVWICVKASGHIQATGTDVRGRKQYRYHARWNKVRSETKFHRLYEFGKALPSLRKQLQKDISISDLCERKVLAAVILLMERTYIRIGNQGYEKMNGSYGLTTFKDKHVAIKSDAMNFSFKGKKGVYHDITLKNKRLAKIVKECRDIPGKELFQYYDTDGSRKSIDSGRVNEYIKEASGIEISAKDFRCWAGSLNILRAFKSMDQALSQTDRKQNILLALDQVSSKLGNTRTVCKSYYVHPGLIQLYEENNLDKYLKDLDAVEKETTTSSLTTDEKVLMKILKELH